ncbi:MAG: MFS transporter [Myxococcota bacterium]
MAAAEEIDARGEAEFDELVRGSLRRNYLAHLGHGIFGQTGFRLIQAPTFVPAYIYSLSGSELVVGVARSVQALGQCLSPLFSATQIEHRRKVLPMGMRTGTLLRLQVLGIALAGFFLPVEWNLSLVCVFLGLFGFFMGMQGVIFNVLLAKVIPIELRGRLSGLRNALAGVTAAGVAYLGGGWLVESNALGNGYAATFLLAFVLTELGLLMLLFIREPDSPAVRVRTGVAARLADLPALLRADANFAVFLAACVLGALGRIAMPYYVLYAQQTLAIGGSELGVLTAAFLLAATTLNLGWGLLADRTGFRVVFLASLAVWIAGTFMLLGAASFAALVGVFVALGAGSGGFMMGQQILVLEFGAREDLPLRIGVVNAATEAMGVVAPLAGGALATFVDYPSVFFCAIAFKLAAAALVVLRMREPRGLAR